MPGNKHYRAYAAYVHTAARPPPSWDTLTEFATRLYRNQLASVEANQDAVYPSGVHYYLAAALIDWGIDLGADRQAESRRLHAPSLRLATVASLDALTLVPSSYLRMLACAPRLPPSDRNLVTRRLISPDLRSSQASTQPCKSKVSTSRRPHQPHHTSGTCTHALPQTLTK